LIIFHKSSQTQSVYYNEAVDEALCFGWIDSKAKKRDGESTYQFFSRRNPKSNWSAVNKKKIETLLAQGLMTEAGLRMVELAKETGTWTALHDVDNLVIPDDLLSALSGQPEALRNFEAFPRSARRGILEWILNARQPATRRKRIEETVAMAARNQQANQYQRKV
jgi:uncharacterized protein YdeI (YjbR/CyaY-like superfamily)